MRDALRKEIFQCFKSLHQARKTVFNGDPVTLREARKRINEEFKKQKHVENIESIRELINYSKAVEHELRTCVIQAEEVAPGKYRAQIRPEVEKLDNIPFKVECCNKSKELNETSSRPCS